jgi:hypothetical protein
VDAALEDILDDARDRLGGIFRGEIGDYHEMTNYKVVTYGGLQSHRVSMEVIKE